MIIHKELFNLHKDLVFKDLTHTYIKNKVNYTSVTTFLKDLTEFRKDYWLLYKSLEYLGYDVKSDASKGVKKDYIQVDGEIYKAINYLEQASYHIDLEKIILNMRLSWANIAHIGVTRGSAIHDYNENLWRGKKMHNEFDNDFKQSHTGVDEYEYKMSIYKLRMFSDNFYNDHKEYLIPISLEQVVSDDELLIAGQIDCLFFDLRDNEYYLYDYKGLALDTPIATPNGYTNIGNLKVNDIVYDGNGKETKVQHVSEIHHNPCYKITFDTNDILTTDHEHKWVVEIDKFNTKLEYTTEELYSHFIKNKGFNKLKIKTTNSLETKESNLPIDPYVLGVWLADGNSHNGTITCTNQKCWDEIELRGYETSNNLEKRKDFAEHRTVYEIRGHLNSLGLLKNKHIPELYLRASHNQRLDLLQGFMDGDGHYNKARKRCVMLTTKKWQADDLAKLIASLGEKPIIIKGKTSGFGKTNIDCFHVCFTPNFNPFLCRNQEIIFKGSTKSTYRYIKSVEKVETIPTKCISVTSKDKTYLAGYNLIKTHNTDKKIETSNYFGKFKGLNLDDCNYNKYSLQVYLYKYILEKHTSIRIKDCKIVWLNKDQNNYKIYNLKNVSSEVEYLIEERKKQLNNDDKPAYIES